MPCLVEAFRYDNLYITRRESICEAEGYALALEASCSANGRCSARVCGQTISGRGRRATTCAATGTAQCRRTDRQSSWGRRGPSGLKQPTLASSRPPARQASARHQPERECGIGSNHGSLREHHLPAGRETLRRHAIVHCRSDARQNCSVAHQRHRRRFRAHGKPKLKRKSPQHYGSVMRCCTDQRMAHIGDSFVCRLWPAQPVTTRIDGLQGLAAPHPRQ
jgi:hypothetical protein